MAYRIREVRTVPEGKRSDYFGVTNEVVQIEELLLHHSVRMVGKQVTLKTKELLDKFTINNETCLVTENAMYFLENIA